MEKILTVARKEKKYILPKIDASNLKKELNIIIKKDDNINIDKYIVRSLYFDSINNKDFHTKLSGVEKHHKIRLRCYDIKDNKCKLEMKLKENDDSYKVSIWILKNDANELIKGNYYILEKYFDKSKDAINIYQIMKLGCYKPVVMIEYERSAYYYPINDTRLTFDYNIRSSETNFDLFNSKILYQPLFDEFVVFEVKYNGLLIGFIKDILKKYHLSQTSMSKYCIGRKVFYDFNY